MVGRLISAKFFLCLVVAAVLILAIAWLIENPARHDLQRNVGADAPEMLVGEVRDLHGPVPGALVRIKAHSTESVLTAAEGRFHLPRPSSMAARITASKQGYLIGGIDADSSPLTIQLTPLPSGDFESYRWVDPAPDPAQKQQCGTCHAEIHDEWAASAHARSVTNRHFTNVYDGSDWQGRPGVGWNLLAEYPDGAGVCTACHSPTVAFDDPAYYDLRLVRGTPAKGVHCDYCHKVSAIANGQVGLTHGRFGLKLSRPAQGQLFFGPLDDVDRGEDAFSSMYRESQYCASCHEGTVFGVHVYSTYSEWLESPARQQGKQCQNCHMAPTGRLANIAPGKGGVDRAPDTLASHRLFADNQLEMLRRCLKMEVQASNEKNKLSVDVTLLAEGAGHRVPTGFSDRNLLLVVEATQKDGSALTPAAGSPRLPAAAGKALHGLAGRLYAKQISDFASHAPVPFWRARPDAIDTRLFPGRIERASFTFDGQAQRVRVRLIHRRFWQEVAESKGWPDIELLIIDRSVDVGL